MTVPSRRSEVAPFYVMEVAKAATQRQLSHGDAIWLCVGQPSTPAPASVRREVAAALEEQVLGYTVSEGIAELRQTIAGEYRRRYGVQVDAGEIIVTTGSSAGFQLAVLAACDVGDAVAMTRPGYPAYRNTLAALGIEVLDLGVDASTRFQPTVEHLEALPRRPRAVVVASPSNPTGTVIDPAELERLAAWCAAHDCLLISDEIYHGIEFGRRCASAREFGQGPVVIGSISKYHSMTGWRLGWLVVPPELRRAIELLQSNLAICAPAISQVAAIAAFGDEATVELGRHVERYARNRDLLLRRLPELGFHRIAPPDGAFYLWLDVAHLTEDSQVWCRDVLDATGVALAPGIDFDPVSGRHWARLSFCGTTEELRTALERLESFLAR